MCPLCLRPLQAVVFHFSFASIPFEPRLWRRGRALAGWEWGRRREGEQRREREKKRAAYVIRYVIGGGGGGEAKAQLSWAA